MFRKYLPSLFLIFLISTATFLTSRSFRVAQLPNGAVNSCANCHVSAAGGGPRNSFGSLVGISFLDGQGNVQWGPELAQGDADGDGVPNGVELQDPDGSWAGGSIGDPNLVSNPGDANSVPPGVTDVEDLAELPSQYKLEQNYPNPFNPSTTINFAITNPEQVSLRIYNNLGQQVAELVNQFLPSGSYTVNFDALSDAGNISSGFYFYNLTTPSFSQTKKMILLK